MIQILIIMFMIKSDTVARQRTGFKVQSYSKNPKNVSDFIIKSNSYIYIYARLRPHDLPVQCFSCISEGARTTEARSYRKTAKYNIQVMCCEMLRQIAIKATMV